MSVSFEAIGQVTVTCQTNGTVTDGAMVKISANDTVEVCAAGEKFCGQAIHVAEDGMAAVQVKGFIEVDCADSTVTAGWAALAADGNGGVKAADQGVQVLVMNVAGGKAVICLYEKEDVKHGISV